MTTARRILASSFSLQMLKKGGTIRIVPSALGEVLELDAEYSSPRGYDIALGQFDVIALGHQGTVDYLNQKIVRYEIMEGLKLLSKGFDPEAAGWQLIQPEHGRLSTWVRETHGVLHVNREEISLFPGDTVVVIQPAQKRLNPGTELNSDAEFSIFKIYVEGTKPVSSRQEDIELDEHGEVL